jgi:hypothetical protein
LLPLRAGLTALFRNILELGRGASERAMKNCLKPLLAFLRWIIGLFRRHQDRPVPTEPLNIKDIIKAEADFHSAYGATLVQWGIIEQRLCFWFVGLTKMPDAMARGIFHDGVHSFEPRARMLKIAARTSKASPALKKFLITTINKANRYSITRNQLSHCETKLDLTQGSPTYKQMILVEGGQPIMAMETTLTLAHLPIITGNFRELSRLIMDVYQDAGSLNEEQFLEFRKQVHALPPEAHDTKPNQNSIKD